MCFINLITCRRVMASLRNIPGPAILEPLLTWILQGPGAGRLFSKQVYILNIECSSEIISCFMNRC